MPDTPGPNTIAVIETEEGRAYYPWAPWGAGYLVDAATERRLQAWRTRHRWITGLQVSVISYLVIRWLPNHPFFGIMGGGVAGIAIDEMIDRILRRHSRRTNIRWNPDRRAASTTRRVNRAARWGLLVAAGSVAFLSIVIAVVFPSLDAWLFAASFALGFVWLARHALYLRRNRARSAP